MSNIRKGVKGAATIAERFAAKMERRGPDECWPWTASTRRGYGIIWDEGRKRPAAQVAWELHNGEPWPEGKHACHICDNPGCVNPAHIFVGDPALNALDREVKGRGVRPRKPLKTHCKNGHEFTPENTGRRGEHERYCRICKRAYERERWPRKKAAV